MANRRQRFDRYNAEPYPYMLFRLPYKESTNIQLRPEALDLSQTWTDDEFERVIDEWWARIGDFLPQQLYKRTTIAWYESRVSTLR